ncbi:MAG: NlpC/P60 family protein, partial [Candidatus Shapirobacteria bacterium]
IRNKKVLREEIKDAVKNSIIEESNLSEEIGNIFSEEKIEQINPELLTGVETEIKITEVKLNNWSNLNQKSVDQFRGEEITNRIELEILKENPNLSPDQLKQVKEYKKLIKQVYFSENSINKDRNEIFDSVSGEFSPGQIKNAWTDTKGLTKLVKMDSKKFKLFSEKYEKIKKSLGDIKLPFNIKECRSFEGLMTMIKGSKLFTRAQKFVGFVNRIANFRTEFMTRIGLKIGNFLIEKIGNQALKSFAQNSLQIIAKNGLEKGFSLILKGILSGGAKAGASAAAGAAGATGAAAASATVPVAGWVVAAVILAAQAVMFIGKKIGQALENMGLSLGIKSFLKDTFGGFLGGALNLALKLAMVIVGLPILLGTIAIGILITPIVIGLMAFSFISQIFTNSQVSSLVPPQTSNTQQTSNTNFTGANEDVNYTNDTGGSLKLDFIKELPPPKTNKRSDLVKTATAIVGVPYYWGGGHGWVVPNHREPSFGIDPNWGSKKVPVDNHAGHGMNRYYYGLDCSGFVSWVYYQTTGVNILSGATAIYNRSTKISADELLPGDIGIACPGGCGGDPTSNHVGIYVGKDKNGRNLFVNSGGSSSHGGPQGFGGVVIDHYPFKGFGRINQGGIQLINDL